MAVSRASAAEEWLRDRTLRRYSFEHGPIHFLQLNTEMDFAPGSPQYAWLLADLRAVDRARTPWLVAGASAYQVLAELWHLT